MSIDFDGSTDYFEITGSEITSNFTSYPFSVFAYVYVDDLTGNGVIFGLGDPDDATSRKYQLGYQGGDTGFRSMVAYSLDNDITSNAYIWASSNANSWETTKSDLEDDPPNAATWYWAAAVFRNADSVSLITSLRAMTTGRKSSRVGSIAFITNTDTLRIGSRVNNTTGALWDGRIAHLGIWNNYELLYRDIYLLNQGALPNQLGGTANAGLYDYWDFDGTAEAAAGNQTGLVNSKVLTANGTPIYKAQPTISGQGTANMSLTLRDRLGGIVTNASGLYWWYYGNLTPAQVVSGHPELPSAAGSNASSDSNGLFSITSISGPNIAAGETGVLVVSNSSGAATAASKGLVMPVKLS